MPDVISLLHNNCDSNLFESITIGNYRLSIQGSKYHDCSPRENLPPYMYDTMEVAVYENGVSEVVKYVKTIPPAIFHELKDKWSDWYFSGLTIKEIQWLYDNLYEYSKLDMKELMCKFYDEINSGSIEYETECIQQCVLTHQITNKDGIFWKNIAIRRMLFKLYGIK